MPFYFLKNQIIIVLIAFENKYHVYNMNYKCRTLNTCLGKTLSGNVLFNNNNLPFLAWKMT